MMMGFDKARAETIDQASSITLTEWLWKRGDVANNPYAKSGTANGMGFSENFAEAVDLWKSIGETVMKILDWFNHFNENVTNLSVDLLAWIYKTLSMIVLHTPVLLFTNEWFKDNILTFASMSVTVFTIFFIYQIIRKMLENKEIGSKVNYTEPKTVFKRFAIAVAGIGFAPFLFEKGFHFVNILAKFITAMGYHEVKSNEFSTSATSIGDSFALLGFDIVLIGTFVPILMQNFRRWFDLILLGAATPLALTAWCFNDTKHYTSQWWKAIKDIGMVQLVYSFFIAVMGIFMLGTRGYTEGFGLVFRLGIMLGGLVRLANPPQFLSRMMDTSNESVLTMYSSLKNSLGMANLTKYKPVNMVKGALWSSMNAKKMKEARSEMGQRFIGSDPTEARQNLNKFRSENKKNSTGKRYNK